MPECLADGLRPRNGHLRRRRVRTSIIRALAVDTPAIAQLSGAVVEKDAAADFAVIRHKQDRAGIDFIIAGRRHRLGRCELEFYVPRGEQTRCQQRQHSDNRRDPARALGPAALPLRPSFRATHEYLRLNIFADFERGAHPHADAPADPQGAKLRSNPLSGGEPVPGHFRKDPIQFRTGVRGRRRLKSAGWQKAANCRRARGGTSTIRSLRSARHPRRRVRWRVRPCCH